MLLPCNSGGRTGAVGNTALLRLKARVPARQRQAPPWPPHTAAVTGTVAGAGADAAAAPAESLAPPLALPPPTGTAPAAPLFPSRMCSSDSTGLRQMGHRCVCLRSSWAHSAT